MAQQAKGTARMHAHPSTPARAAAGRGGHARQRTQQLPRKVSARAAPQTPHAAGPSSPGPPQQENGTCLRKSKRASAGARRQQVLEQVQDPLRAARRQHSASCEAGCSQRADPQPRAKQLGQRLLGRQRDAPQLLGRARGPRASVRLSAAEQAFVAAMPKPRFSLGAQQLSAAPGRAVSWARPRRKAAQGVQHLLDSMLRPASIPRDEAKKRPHATGDQLMRPRKQGRWGHPAEGAVPAQPCAAAAGASSPRNERRLQAHAASIGASHSGWAVHYSSGLRSPAQQPGSFNHAHTKQQWQVNPAATAVRAAGPPSAGSLATAALSSQQHRGVQQFLHVTAGHQVADVSTPKRTLHRNSMAQEHSPGKQSREKAQQVARRQTLMDRASKLPASGYKRKQLEQSLYGQIGNATQALQPSLAAKDDQNKASLLYSTSFADPYMRPVCVILCHAIGYKAQADQPSRSSCERPEDLCDDSSAAHPMQVLMGILERAADLHKCQLPQPESPAGRERLPER